LAAVLGIGEFLSLFAFSHISLVFAGQSYETIANIWASLRGPIFYVAQLIALGAIIETLDQIRWDARGEGAAVIHDLSSR
jgi:hypothetical protein